jgi:hypothetical protein
MYGACLVNNYIFLPTLYDPIYSLSFFQEDMMETQINDRQLPKFRPLLQEGQVYYIKHFLVLPARKICRQVENDYMVRFTVFTRVFRLENAPSSFPCYAHRAVPFSILRSHVGIREFASGIRIKTNLFPYMFLPS